MTLQQTIRTSSRQQDEGPAGGEEVGTAAQDSAKYSQKFSDKFKGEVDQEDLYDEEIESHQFSGEDDL